MSKKNPYAAFMKKWNAKLMGEKPTERELATAEALGFRSGSKVAFANAMYLREGGATADQIILAVGKPQLNGRRALVAAGIAKKGGEKKNPETNRLVYFTELTARGLKLVQAKIGQENPEAEPVQTEV